MLFHYYYFLGINLLKISNHDEKMCLAQIAGKMHKSTKILEQIMNAKYGKKRSREI